MMYVEWSWFVILLHSRLLRYVLTMVVCMCFRFVLISELFMVLRFVLMCVELSVLLNLACFLRLGVSSCRCCVLVSAVHPVAILSAVFCVTCSLSMFVSDARSNHMVETYSGMSLVTALHVASVISFCFLHVVHVSALSICIVH